MDLLKLIENYIPYDDNETADKESFLYFLNSFEKKDRATRDNILGHLAASAWVVNNDKTKVLFAYHNIYDSRAWLGGHADGDLNLLKVAEKEAEEESWIKNLIFLQEEPICIDASWVKMHKKKWKIVPNHIHYNVTYLFQADENDKIINAEWENSAVDWIPICDLFDRVSEEHIKPIYSRIIEKVKKL